MKNVHLSIKAKKFVNAMYELHREIMPPWEVP